MSSQLIPPIARACEAATSECRHLKAEIDAFEQFVDRVRVLAVDNRVADGGTTLRPGPRTVTCTCDTARFHNVREAFRDTVLAVEHWEAAYGEATVAEGLAGEFSPALAHLVVNPGTAPFTPAVRTQLLEASDQAIARRHRTLSYVEAEVAELERLGGELKPVAELLEAIRARRATFDTRIETVRQARQRLERLLATHQAYIHDCPRRRYEPLIHSVYADIDVEYPGLAALATAVGQLEALELQLWTDVNDDEWTASDRGREPGRGAGR